MMGNVWQWMQDKYQDSYKGTPTDGSAFEAAGSIRVMRGGSFYSVGASRLRADRRFDYGVPGFRSDGIGFRLAR